MPKIALALIVKDDSELERLDNCLKSVAPYVQGIFITGTKEPQDKIKKLCKKYNAVWSWFEWTHDFSAARNFNFAQVPKEYEWIFWCDTDDLVVGGETFQQAIDLAVKNNISAVFARYLYQVEFDEKGHIKHILIEHLRERLIKNDNTFKWVAPIHETLIEQRPAGKTDFQGFYVVHTAQPTDMETSMWRNIGILEQEVINNPQDPRPIYYLAKAYFDTRISEVLYESCGDGMDSITMELLRDYIRKSGWAEERGQCWEYLSMIHRERQEYKQAIYALMQSLVEFPNTPSVYIQLSLIYTLMKDWIKAMHWVKLAGNVDIPKTTLVVNPRDYKTMMLEALFHIYLNTGKLDEAYKVAQGLVELLPTDINKSRLAGVEDVKHRNDVAHYVVKLAAYLKEKGENEQLTNLLNSIPLEIVNEPALVSLKQEFMPVKNWGKDEIVIYCGPGWEKWSPKSLAKGIGGSEEAVIYNSRELTKLGWKVTVFAGPEDEAGEYDGVVYKNHYDINWKDNFNVFISWRNIAVFDMPIRAKKSYLWNHDLQNNLTYTPDRLSKIDKVFFLSKFHRDNVPCLSEDKVMITGNGVII
jgi:tetratricopeptide (TPR) repeat protein